MRMNGSRMKLGALTMSAALVAPLCMGADAGAGSGIVGGGGIAVVSSSSMDGNGQVTITTTTVSNGVPHTVIFTTNGISGMARREGVTFKFPEGGTDDKPTTWLGVSVDPLPEMVRAQLPIEGTAGVIVRHVAADSPASKAGLLENDVLVKLDDQQLFNHEQLHGLVSGHKEGDTVTLSLLRKGKATSVQATLVKKVVTEADQVYDVGGWNMPSRFMINIATNGAIILKRPTTTTGNLVPDRCGPAASEDAPVTFETDSSGGTNAMSRANLERIKKQRELARIKKEEALKKQAAMEKAAGAQPDNTDNRAP